MDKVFNWFSAGSNSTGAPLKLTIPSNNSEKSDIKDWSKVNSKNNDSASVEDDFDVLTISSEGTAEESENMGVLSLPASVESSPLASPIVTKANLLLMNKSPNGSASSSPSSASSSSASRRLDKLTNFGAEWKLSLLDSVLNNRYLEHAHSSSPSTSSAPSSASASASSSSSQGSSSSSSSSKRRHTRKAKNSKATLVEDSDSGDSNTAGTVSTLPTWYEIERLLMESEDSALANKQEQQALVNAQRKQKSFNLALGKNQNMLQSSTGNSSSATGNRHKGSPRFFGSSNYSPLPRGATKNYRK